MLRYLGVENFKAFDERGISMELAPVTLIFGPNSSGKSAILDALMVLRQTWERSIAFSELHVVGRWADLGSFENALHRSREGQQGTGRMRFTLATDRLNGWRVGLEYSSYNGDESPYLGMLRWLSLIGPHYALKLEPKWDLKELGSERVERVTFKLGGRDKEAAHQGVKLLAEQLAEAPAAALLARLQADSGERWSTEVEIYHDSRGVSRRQAFVYCRFLRPLEDEDGVQQEDKLKTEVLRFPPEPLQEPEWPAELTDELERVCSLLESRFDLHADVGAELESMFRIGPARVAGARLYTHSATALDVGFDGHNTAPLLIGKSEELQAPVNVDLKLLGSAYEVALHQARIPPGIHGVTLTLRERGSAGQREMFLPDVGFGLSQVLPVLVQRRLMEEADPAKRGTLLVQQPELHLHPAWQANLAEVLTQPGEDEAGAVTSPSTFLILETHSEHLVLRLQSMVRQRRLAASCVRFVVLEVLGDGVPRATSVALRQSGHFNRPWPAGFFPERRNEERTFEDD